MSLSQQLKIHGWIPGFPSYDRSWEGFEVKYFFNVAWHRKKVEE